MIPRLKWRLGIIGFILIDINGQYQQFMKVYRRLSMDSVEFGKQSDMLVGILIASRTGMGAALAFCLKELQ